MSIGAFGENFPYTNFHDLNLDWIIKTLKELNGKFDEAIASKIKFADPLQWDITKQYEPLTIVQDNEHIYLSSQPVPAGVAITNTDYWQPVFNMQEFYDMINDLNDRVAQEIQDLTEYVDNSTVKNNSARHLLYVGDSYSVWHNARLYKEFVNHSGIPASQCHNVAVSGSAFGDGSFLTQISNYTGDKNEITDILVVGGINDALLQYNTPAYPDISGLVNAMTTFYTYATQNYPNATVHIAYVGGTMTSSEYYETLHPAKSQMMAFFAYTSTASSIGFKVLNTYNIIHLTPNYYSADGLHPNVDGAIAIGTAVASTFNKNPVPAIRPAFRSRLTYGSTFARTGTVDVTYEITNDITTLRFDTSACICNANQSITINWVEILDMNGNEFRIKAPIVVPCTLLLNGFNNTDAYHPVPAEIKIENGKLYIKVTEINTNGTSYKTFVSTNNNASITIPGFSINTETFNIN